jgi:hypothetical protein
MLHLAGLVFCFVGKGVVCTALLSVEYFHVPTVQASLLSEGFVKSAGAVFNPVWEQ